MDPAPSCKGGVKTLHPSDPRTGAEYAMPFLASRGLAGSSRAAVVLVLAAFVAALGAVRGEFVYDDHKQIVANPLVQRPELLARGLTSDVWRFKGDGSQPWSSYWRPTFVLWLAANWQLFGAQPLPFRLALALLHAVVVLLARGLLLRLGWQPWGAFVIALLFALHPAHVESVAWISGAPDPLFAAGTLAALLCELRAADSDRPWLWRTLGLGAATLALLAKEAAIGLPLLVVATTHVTSVAGSPTLRLASAVRRALPYAVLAAAYLAGRVAVLGGIAGPAVSHATPLELIAAVPRVLAFYLRQVLLPIWIAPTYPLRFEVPPLASWLLPLALLAGSAVLVHAALRARRDLAAMALTLFLVPLAPAFHLLAFQEEQLVHDRYLYLPLLGILALVAIVGEAITERMRLGRRFVGVAVAGIALALGTRTLVAARDFRTNRALFEAAVRSDPGSAYHRAQLAEELFAAGEIAQAGRQAALAIAIAPATTALVVRAKCALAAGDSAAGIRDLELVVRAVPLHAHAWELLATAQQRSGDVAAAERTLRAAREAAPHRRCSITGNLAVVLYLQGRKNEAAAALDEILAGDPLDPNPACELAPFRLGSLRAELGDRAAAKRAFALYLERSRDRDPELHRGPREAARQALAELASR